MSYNKSTLVDIRLCISSSFSMILQQKNEAFIDNLYNIGE